MARICGVYQEAHGDGQPCPYLGMTPEQIRITKLEKRVDKLEKKPPQHKHLRNMVFG